MSNINKIIAELIEIDPAFKDHEEDLRKVVADLIEAQPEVNLDPVFVAKLREELFEKNEELKSSSSLLFNLLSMKFFKSFGSGLIVSALLLTPMFYLLWGMEKSLPSGTFELTGETSTENALQITQVNDNSFGKLTTQEESGNAKMSEPSGLEFAGRGGGGGGMPMAVESAVDSKMISPMIMPYTQYRYIYDGDIVVPEEDVTVLRNIETESEVDTKNLLKSLNLSLIKSSIFKNLTPQNITLSEDREFGLSFNLNSNSVSISKNWNKWPNPNDNCLDEKCYEKNRLKLKDVPADAELIKIADQFIEKLNVNMSPYGEPIINKTWEDENRYLAKDQSPYIPTEISVLYPLVIDGQTVYSEWGTVAGLSVNVDILYKKAAGLQNLKYHQYESANYKSANVEDVKKAVENGGRRFGYSIMSEDTKAEIVEVKLGEPTQILTNIYQWNQEERSGQELLVPALSFPVLEDELKEDQRIYRKVVIVPLAQDLYEENDRPVPMPLIKQGMVEPMIEPMIVE